MLLDTNIIIDLFKGDRNISDFLDKQAAIYIPSTVLGELYLGAYRSADPDKHLKKIHDFKAKCIVLSVDDSTADQYGIIKTGLLAKGKPVPENDIWIAAIAKQLAFQLVTKDSHFKEVEGIQVRFW